MALRTDSPGEGLSDNFHMTVAQTGTPTSSCLKQQMAQTMALWPCIPHSQARWLPGYCSRPAATWPALPCVRWQAPSSHQPVFSLRCCPLLCTRERHPGKERNRSLCPAEPELWQLSLLGQMPSHTHCRGPCRLDITVLPPCPSQSSEPPYGCVPAPNVCPGICLAHGEETKVPRCQWEWPGSGPGSLKVTACKDSLYGRCLPNPQGDLHFCLSIHPLGPLPAQWNLASSTADWSGWDPASELRACPLPLAQHTGV